MAKSKTPLIKEFAKGLWKDNPVLIMLLGLCPTLAVTNSATNGLAMGLATTFVLLSSSIIISLLRKVIPHQVRIAGYIVIIATFVTVADKFLAAYLPDISKSLGPYVPLIVVNCLILGRQEAFSSKNGVGRSIIDGLGMGLGFIWVLVVLGGIREILGSATLFNLQVLGDWFNPWMVMILPPGAFLTLGLIIGLGNWINDRRAKV
jgi:electron transport complex protein RnfE